MRENRALTLATGQGGMKERIKKKNRMQRMWEPTDARKGNWDKHE